jgi:hypothetical protein
MHNHKSIRYVLNVSEAEASERDSDQNRQKCWFVVGLSFRNLKYMIVKIRGMRNVMSQGSSPVVI